MSGNYLLWVLICLAASVICAAGMTHFMLRNRLIPSVLCALGIIAVLIAIRGVVA